MDADYRVMLIDGEKAEKAVGLHFSAAYALLKSLGAYNKPSCINETD